jgi:hypothetical protein
MDFLCVWRFISIWGIVVLLKPISAKDRLEIKKYMGVWRCECELTAGMMSRFPSTVITYTVKNSPKKGLQFSIIRESQKLKFQDAC